jgi:Zn-dependent M28 family amino/carboxypeptidase
LKDQAGVHDLQLILFGGEEEGLFGSLHHVAQLAPADRERLRAVVNMDMIGTLNTPTPAVLLEGADVSRGLIDGLAAAAATYTGLTIQVSLDPFGSDHMPFINNGLAAVLTIEGTDQANENEHTANDTLDHINYELMLEILRMNTAFIASELDRQE